MGQLEGKVAVVTGAAQGIGLTVDVADEAAVQRLVDETVARCGSLDVLVNNAGLYATLAMRPFTEIPLDEWRRVMDVNVAFTRALARELGKDAVRVNCVAPGFTMSQGVLDNPEVVKKLRDVSVSARTIQRDQEPEDVVGAVVYLASPSASFVTGQTIVIDGGQYFH
jgi:NAD(P)-dependent dehydrogenase (short-subunit alcohol dehydrogenase family)